MTIFGSFAKSSKSLTLTVITFGSEAFSSEDAGAVTVTDTGVGSGWVGGETGAGAAAGLAGGVEGAYPLLTYLLWGLLLLRLFDEYILLLLVIGDLSPLEYPVKLLVSPLLLGGLLVSCSACSSAACAKVNRATTMDNIKSSYFMLDLIKNIINCY